MQARVDLPWDERDWREMSEQEQSRQLEMFLEQDRAQDFDLFQGPLDTSGAVSAGGSEVAV